MKLLNKILIISIFFIFFVEKGYSANDEIYKKIDVFSEVLDKINNEFVDDIDQNEIMDAAINGVLQSLDPYSAYLSPEMLKEMQTETSGQFGGLGIEVGMEAGVVNLLSGDPPSIAQQLIASDIVKKISITGSSRVGKLILKQAADKVQRVTMELSGHSPFIVFKDADIKKATDIAIAAKFRNNGQVCISPNRFYIQEEKKDEFVNLFVEKTKKLKIGNGMDPDTQLGPLTTQKRLNEVETLVEKTKKEGAKVLLGGKRPAGFNKGFFYEPTIFDDVKDDFTIMKEEPFGPLVPMLSFKSFDEVIKRANNHELGLCSYVCTNSMEKAHLASEQLETGSVAVNTGVVAIAEAPFGGIKQSGYGREGGSNAIKDYLNVKYTHLGIKG